MPKYSVIIPVYNTEKYLEQCLESVINQTLKDIEIICVNDGSTDNSLNILQEYQAKDNRIKIINQENSGAGKARNTGIENSNCEYLYFLDSDDYIEPNALEKLLTSIGDADICLCKCQYFDEATNELKKPSKKRKKTDNIFKIHPVPLFTKLYKASLIKDNGIRCQETKVCNDVYFNYASAILASSIVSVPDALVTYRISHSGCLSSSRGKYTYCVLEAFSALKDLLEKHNKMKQWHKEFYKCARRGFKFELKLCDKTQKDYYAEQMDKFLPARYRLGKLFDIQKDILHIVIKIFGFKIKIRTQKCPPPEKYEAYLKSWFFKTTGQVLDLENPKTFNEKIQWLKLYDSTPLKTRLADKYLVRDWVKEKIGEEYLIPLLGVWDKFDDIDFDKLPDRFVLKCNHGCAYNIIVKDKSKFNKKEARKKINKWMKENFAYKTGLELHYADIPRKIIAEEYIEDSNKELNDYKIMCFNGKPQYIWIDQGRFSNRTENIYNKKWELQPFLLTYPNSKEQVPPPKNLDKMFKFAKILSEGFSFVRVDFYNIDGKIYFGEMTFTSASGTEKFIPSEYNRILGDMLELPYKE